jgi:hypothetical protein
MQGLFWLCWCSKNIVFCLLFWFAESRELEFDESLHLYESDVAGYEVVDVPEYEVVLWILIVMK